MGIASLAAFKHTGAVRENGRTGPRWTEPGGVLETPPGSVQRGPVLPFSRTAPVCLNAANEAMPILRGRDPGRGHQVPLVWERSHPPSPGGGGAPAGGTGRGRRSHSGARSRARGSGVGSAGRTHGGGAGGGPGGRRGPTRSGGGAGGGRGARAERRGSPARGTTGRGDPRARARRPVHAARAGDARGRGD